MRTIPTVALFAAAALLAPIAAPAIEVYQARTVQPYEARTMTPTGSRPVRPERAQRKRNERAEQPDDVYHGRHVVPYRSGSQSRLYTRKDFDEMRRNDEAAGRTHSSMSPGRGGGGAAAAQARANHYSNVQNLNKRMDDAGTIGYNPFRNQ